MKSNTEQADRTTAKDFLLLVAIVFGSAILIFCVQARAPRNGPVAVIFPPWWNGTESLRASASAGSIIRFGAFPFVVVVAPRENGYAETLRGSGAWLIIDPRVIGGCGSAIQGRSS